MSAEAPGNLVRKLLAKPGIIRSVGVHDVVTGIVAEQAGIELVFLGGFGASASLLGLPDRNYLGATEMADATRRLSARVSIPVIADGDTGHGEGPRLARCVEEFERAGAAGMLLEDQVFPKRCGHFEGKQVISTEDMLAKWETALAARRDPDFVFIARTDARAVHGIDDAIDRVNRYCDAGADIAFVEAPESVAEIEAIAKRVPYPKFINMLSFGKTPILSADELEQLGYKIVVAPIATLLASVHAVRAILEEFLSEGQLTGAYDRMVSFAEIQRLLAESK